MPVARFQMPDGRIARFEVPEGTSPEQAQSLMEAHFSTSSAPTAQSADVASSEGMPSTRRFDFATATPEEKKQVSRQSIAGGNPIFNVIGGGVRGAGSIGATLLRPFESAEENQQRREAMTSALQQLGANPESFGFKSGKIGGEIAGTAGIGGGIATALRAVPGAMKFAPNFINAIETGGFGAKIAENRLADVALRGLAGATSGAATIAPVDPDSVGIGAGFGAALPTIAASYKAVAPFVSDLLKGRTAELRAAEIARQAAGPELSAIQQAARVAPSTETAGQAVAGVDRAQIQSLAQAVGERDASNALRRKLAQQTAVDENTLSQMAGGPTQAAAMQEAERMKSALNAQTRPMREQAIGGANKTTATVQKAEEISKRGREFGVPPGESNAYLYPPGSTEREVALATAKSAEDRIASIKAAGLEPLNVNGMVSSIEKKLSTPDIGIPDLNAKALNNVSSKLKEWSDKNGAITGEALYAIRKSAINDVIDSLMPNASQSAKNARAASVMTEVKPIIDNAIEKAGGKGWKDYLQTYEMGMRGIDQSKMAAQLMDLYRTNKPGFSKLIANNDPSAVEAIFGPGSYDIVKEMGSKIEGLRPIASNIDRAAAMADMAKAGSTNLQEIIKANTSNFRIPSFIPKSSIPNAVLAEMQSRLSTKVLDQLERGFQSGASLNELLSKVPTQHRDFVARAIMRSVGSMGGARNLPINMLSPSNENALSQNQ